MRAWQITDTFSIDGLKLNTYPDPAPGPGQVVINVKVVSLNFRDLLVIKGLYTKKLPRPLTICSDAAGEIAAVGEGVTRVKPGDRVCGIFMPRWIAGQCTDVAARSARGAFEQGVLADQVVMGEEMVVRTPEHLTDSEAATLPCAAVTAWNALIHQGGLKAGETVLVQGTGGVSIIALQLAKAAGARVVATTSSDAKAERLQSLGASIVVNYTSAPEWDEALRKSAGYVDQVIEIGGAGTFNRSLKAVRMGGYIALIGNRAAASDDVPNLTTALMKSVRVQGVFVGSREMFEAMNRAIVLHSIRPVVDREFAFEEAQAALSYFESGAHVGKVVLSVPLT
jgi:NADPH:quinone reductase-like Zn-dependent oxidoreductase